MTFEERLNNIEIALKEIKQLLQPRVHKESVATRSSNEDDILNINEAMVLLNMERHILYEKCANKDIPSFRVGKQYKFKRNELLEWQAAQQELQQTDVDDFVSRYLNKNQIRG